MSEYLPPEIIRQILSRLPAESAVRCTAVCKAWCALIKHPSFISTHLQQAESLQDDDLLLLCFRDKYYGPVFQLQRDNDAFEVHMVLPPPPNPFRNYRVVGACNGLICLSHVEDDDWNIILWNPSIHKHFVLPEPDLRLLPGSSSRYALGFGFDSASEDYKVLLIVLSNITGHMHGVWLFSLNRRRSWMRLTEFPPIHRFYNAGKAVFVKGALHYLMSSNMIMAFDMSTEKFFEINIPDALLVHLIPRMCLVKYEESIALFFWGSSPNNQLELWVMKEYGVESSWTKVLDSVDKNGEFDFVRDLVEIFLVKDKGKAFINVRREDGHGYELATLDLNCLQQEEHHKQQQQQQLKRLGGPENHLFTYIGSYVESLVLVDIGEEDACGRHTLNHSFERRAPQPSAQPSTASLAYGWQPFSP